MLLKVKAIRQEFSVDDGDTTNMLILQVPGTGEEFVVLVADDTVKRLIEVRAGLPPEPPSESSMPYAAAGPTQYPAQLTGPTMGIDFGFGAEGAVVFGGESLPAPPPVPVFEEELPEPLPEPEQAKTVEQQMRERARAKAAPQQPSAPARTVPKDELGYPIVPNLRKGVAARDSDEDGIGQA